MVCVCGHKKTEHHSGKRWTKLDMCLVPVKPGFPPAFCPCLKYEEESLDKAKVEMSVEMKGIIVSIINNGFRYLHADEQPKDIDDVIEFLLKNALNHYLKLETRHLLYNYQLKRQEGV